MAIQYQHIITFDLFLIANQAHSKSQVNTVGCRRENESLNGRSSKYDSVAEKQ